MRGGRDEADRSDGAGAPSGAAAARARLEQRIAAGDTGTGTHLALAKSCHALGDHAGEARALDAVLAAEPHHPEALLMRGDWHRRTGDRRAATCFYQVALTAARKCGQMPPTLAGRLDGAARYIREAAGDYQQYLLDSLRARGADPDRSGSRFAEALDMLLGRKPACLQRQRPSVFYFPGLPQNAFYNRSDFAWAPALEAATAEIRAELVALIDSGAEFTPYVEQEEGRPFRNFHGLNGSPAWSAFHLWRNGRLVEENAARCPLTVGTLEKVPMTRMGNRTPSVLFSLLRPGTRIPPHHGMLNTRLICHLPLIVPPGCSLRVGGETRYWREGELMIFDDSVEHEAHNPTSALRVILLFDIWRPELDAAERRAMDALFSAIDDYKRAPPGD